MLAAINFAALSFGEIVIYLIIAAGLIAILFIATRAMGVTIPQWVIQIFWVCVIVVVAILAIRFLLSL